MTGFVLMLVVAVCSMGSAGVVIIFLFRRGLAARSIPLDILIDEQVPISLPERLRIPLDAELNVSFKEVVRAEASIPVELMLPLDTVIETTVLGIGKLKIPIKAMIPISVVIPISVPVTVDASRIPIRLRQDIDVRLPDFVLPLKTKLRVGIPIWPFSRRG